jgi:hypothetical protein
MVSRSGRFQRPDADHAWRRNSDSMYSRNTSMLVNGLLRDVP